MNTKQLRQKILDLAIRGKLVPQNPEDEPAYVLLERVRAEKERLIKEGKIRRDKNEGKIAISDTSYYPELPNGWTVAPISDLFIVNPRNSADDNLVVSFVPMTLVEGSFSNRFTYQERKWDEIKSGFTHFADGDVGIAKITPCLENRKSAVFHNLKNGIGAGTTELHIFRTVCNASILPEYLLWFFKNEGFIENCIGAFSGAVGQQRVSKDHIADTLLPVPPFAEQQRIVATIQTAFTIIDEIEVNKSDLLSTVTATKQKILSLAISGKLVPQDENDEPASVLLDRIRIERERLFKSKKNKKTAAAPAVKPAHSFSYCGLPANWTEVKLDEVLEYQQPTEHIVKNVDYDDKYKTPVLTAGKSFIIGYTNEEFGICRKLPVIVFDDFTTDSKFVDFPFKVKSSAMKILRANIVDIKYLYYLMQTIECNSSTHKRYWISDYSQKIVPLSPLAEQKRIVAAVETAFEQLDGIVRVLN